MKIKSVSGITAYVSDLDATDQFYEALGFETKKREPDHITVYSNWFWIDFLSVDKNERLAYPNGSDLSRKGAGLFIYLSVDDVDGFYKFLLSKGLQPETMPQKGESNLLATRYPPPPAGNNSTIWE